MPSKLKIKFRHPPKKLPNDPPTLSEKKKHEEVAHKSRRRELQDEDFLIADAKSKKRRRDEVKRSHYIENFRFEKEKIPEEKLRNAIYSVLTEKTDNFHCYKDICSQLKDQQIPPAIPDCYVRTQYEARNCLLNQDWTNFSRLLFLLIQNEKKIAQYTTTTFKYFLLSLLHDPEVKDKDFLEAFLSSVFDCNTPAEMRNFMREVSTLKKMEFNTNKRTKAVNEKPYTVKLPDIDMDSINLENAKNARKLFMGQKRKVSHLHKATAHKTYTKK